MRRTGFGLRAVSKMDGVLWAGARRARRCHSGLVASQRFQAIAERAARASERVHQLERCAFCGRGIQHRFGMFESSMLAERHVAKAEHRERADDRFYATPTEDSEHRRSLAPSRYSGRISRYCWHAPSA